MAKINKREEVNLLWSDDQGDLRKSKSTTSKKADLAAGDVLKIELLKNKRGGKTVSLIKDLPHNPAFFMKLTKKLKAGLGTGGSFKNDTIEIQGDHRDKLIEMLAKMGIKSKKSGG